MRKTPYQSPLRNIPISVSLFKTVFGLPNTPHSRLSHHLRICNCRCGNFRFHRLFRPYCSISICRKCSFPELPILRKKNPRCPSSPNELMIIDLFFFIRANGSIYKGNKIGSQSIITLTSN